MTSQKAKLLALYALMGLSALLCCFPSFALQNAGYGLIFAVLILAYILRALSPEESLERNHAKFIVRSIWIYSLIALIGTIAAGIMVGQKGDFSALDQILTNPENAENLLRSYFETNRDLIESATRIWMFPAQLYLIWRMTHGISRAGKSYRISKPDSWF
jgi:uncharacterized membrane protein